MADEEDDIYDFSYEDSYFATGDETGRPSYTQEDGADSELGFSARSLTTDPDHMRGRLSNSAVNSFTESAERTREHEHDNGRHGKVSPLPSRSSHSESLDTVNFNSHNDRAEHNANSSHEGQPSVPVTKTSKDWIGKTQRSISRTKSEDASSYITDRQKAYVAPPGDDETHNGRDHLAPPSDKETHNNGHHSREIPKQPLPGAKTKKSRRKNAGEKTEENDTVLNVDPSLFRQRALRTQTSISTGSEYMRSGPVKETSFTTYPVNRATDTESRVATPSGVRAEISDTEPSLVNRSSCCIDIESACGGCLSGHKHLKRFILFGVPVCFLLLLFLILMPVSFIYVEHHMVALMESKSTGVVNKQHTYYPGCYLLGPDSDFLYFRRAGNMLNEFLNFFTSSRLEITLEVTLVYFLKTEEIGVLYATYGDEYDQVIRKVIIATLKNTASRFTLDEFRINRTDIEKVVHDALNEKVQGLHVDIPYVWMGLLQIPASVNERFLNSLILQVEAETEVFRQQFAVVEKQTAQKVAVFTNTAQELNEGAKAFGNLLTSKANAVADQKSELSIIQGWDGMCQRLGFTQEEHRLSLLFINSLEGMDNLYMAPNNVANNNYTYTYFSGFNFLHG